MPAYDHPNGWEWYGSFTLSSCVPIREVCRVLGIALERRPWGETPLLIDSPSPIVFQVVAVNVSSAITREFYDITLGVDPNDFIPPSYCPQ